MNADYDASYPIFVRNDQDRLRWKASIDAVTVVYGLRFPRDVDLSQMLARSCDGSDIPTAQLLGPQPKDRPE
jgi:hypothetical protein